MRTILLLAICVSLGGAVLPLRASAATSSPRADCCAHMLASKTSHECEKQAPHSAPVQQCCAACVIGLALFANAATLIVPPPLPEENFAAYVVNEEARAQRPPVPPPRRALS